MTKPHSQYALRVMLGNGWIDTSQRGFCSTRVLFGGVLQEEIRIGDMGFPVNEKAIVTTLVDRIQESALRQALDRQSESRRKRTNQVSSIRHAVQTSSTLLHPSAKL